MGLFQLIAQIMGLCGVVTAIALGLLTAPWYVLIALLLTVIAITQSLMPKQDIRISTLSKEVSKSVFAPSRIPQATSSTLSSDESQENLLLYRGVIYSKEQKSNS